MHQGLVQVQKLQLQQRMNLQLQLAIRLLQMSRAELQETVQRELLENPFLEEIPYEAAPVENSEIPLEKPAAENDAPFDHHDVIRDMDWEDYLGEFSSAPRTRQSEHETVEESNPLEARYATSPNLESHLMWQLCLSSLTERQKQIGEIIIGNLSSSGYLECTLEEIAHVADEYTCTFGEDSRCRVDEIEQMLGIVQQFDPVGVAARTPSECLLAQIRFLGYDRDPVLVDLVTNHLQDLESRNYRPLLRKFRLDMDGLKEYLDIIRSLDPMPGASYGSCEPIYVHPDVRVVKIDGQFRIIMDDEGLPNLHLNPAYLSMSESSLSSDRKYATTKQHAAEWLIKSLEVRRTTLYKVVESLLKFQRGFFEEGVSKLRPLILKDIAEDIGVHESTVSRITTNKYIATPFGVHELKFFFNSKVNGTEGGEIGSECVKALIRKLIEKEDRKDPLSDETIGEILKNKHDVDIARRTVAKYRTQLGFASSSKRRVRC